MVGLFEELRHDILLVVETKSDLFSWVNKFRITHPLVFADTTDRARSSGSGGTIPTAPLSSGTAVPTPVIPTAPDSEEASLCFQQLLQ